MRAHLFSALTAVGAVFAFAAPDEAAAAQRGCDVLPGQSISFDGTSVTGVNPTLFGAFAFEQGERVEFEVTLTGQVTPSVTVNTIIIGAASGGGDETDDYIFNALGTQEDGDTLETSGVFQIGAGFQSGAAVGDTVTVTFLSCSSSGASSASAEQIQEAVSQASAKAAITQQSGLVFGRTNAIVRGKPAAEGVQTAAVAPAGLLGGAGQASGDGYGVWVDGTWTGLENRDATTGADGHSFALGVGADTQFANGLTAGLAVSFGGALFEARNRITDSVEFNVGLTPYAAFQINETFALQGALGYGYARGETETNSVKGDYNTHRYFAGVEASSFNTFGDGSLFSSVGVLWAQSFQAAYTDDAGNPFGSQRTNLGSVNVALQPAWLFTIDADAGEFIEPYVLGEYSYDFTQTKVRGAANDPDAFRVGIGANIFAGDLSGGVEAIRELGREDNSATTVRATGRMDF